MAEDPLYGREPGVIKVWGLRGALLLGANTSRGAHPVVATSVYVTAALTTRAAVQGHPDHVEDKYTT